MKSKYSTGYLTPQANRVKKNINPRLSESHEDLSVAMNMNDSIFEKLMSCPVKRQLVLNLISSEKDNIKKYKKRQEQRKKECNESPLSKVQKKHMCESPTALLRRRALEQQDRQSPSSENQLDEDGSRSNSRQSSVSSGPSPIPFNKLLDGVIAYVEIKSKDQDRSNGAKALMRSMGAIVRDQFTKDVTHVIFKDGSFTTYQKAKLMKVHLVSVLWIEAVRSSNTKVSEKKFPALGTEAYDHNVSSLCSQMQKDYEEIIRDELRRSIATGTPLPSTQSFIDRRRTIMTPIPSTSKFFSQESQSSQDKEVEQIIHNGRKTYNFGEANTASSFVSKSPELTDDDSDLSPFINGSIIKRRKNVVIPITVEERVIINSIENLGDYTTPSMELTNTDSSKSLISSTIAANNNKQSNIYGSSMDLTTLDGHLIIDESVDSNTKENTVPNTSDNSIYYKKTPKLKSKKSSETNSFPNKPEDNVFNIPDESLYKRCTRQLKNSIDMSSDNSTNVSTDALLKNRIDNSSHSAMSSLELSHQSDGLQILSKNTCTTNTNPLQIQCKNLTSLQLSNEKPNNNVEKSTSTNMSSLHISSDSNKDKNNIGEENVNKCIEKSTSTNMSLLLISSDSIKDKTNQKENNFVNAHSESIKKNPLTKAKQNQSYNSNTSANNSFSPLNSNLVIEVLNILDKTTLPDENVTKRRGRNSVNKSIAYRTRRKTILPDGNNTTDSDNSRESEKIVGEASPSKKLKINSKSEVRTQTPPQKKVNDSDDCNNKNKKLRERRRTANKKNEPDITSKKTNKDKCINKTSDDSQSVSDTNDSSGSERKRRRLRKLYNPDESINDVIESDEKEREDKRTKVTKQKSDGVILNPNIVCVTSNILLTTRAKEFIDKNNIDIQTVLNKESESEKEITSVKRGKKKDEKKVSINGDADEQQELAEEFINKKKTKKRTTQHVNSEGKVVNRRQSARLSQHPRKKLNLNSSTSSNDVNTEGMLVKKRQSVRLSQHPKKKFNLNSSTSSNEERGIIPITPVINRRSTMEFQTLTQMSAKKRLKIDISKRPSIVCTKLHKDGIQVFNQIVKKLGGFVIEDEVSSKTTHLVAGESKRTINMLRAIARGCWILKHEWLLKSLEEGKWLPEEDYELTDFSPAVQQCRLQRQAFGPSYSMDIFQDCEPIYIARGSIPRCSDLRELVSLCKGRIVTLARNASIVVGESVRNENVKCVKEMWVLDSLTYNKKMPLKKYIIQPASSSPAV